MSTWIEAKKDDVFLSDDKKEVNIHIDDDYAGAIYVSIKIDYLKEILAEE